MASLPRPLLALLVAVLAIFAACVAADAACIDALATGAPGAGAPLSFAISVFTWSRAVSSGASVSALFSVAAASAGLFICAYAMLAISFWPYMVPFSLTVAAAASPHASLAFMFWGEGLFIYPLMLGYTAYSYHVFKGKVDLTSGHY